MGLIDNTKLYKDIESGLTKLQCMEKNEIILRVFQKDFRYRFCWSSNALEGNTLSLDETVALIDYDETRGGHTYKEYWEAKNLFSAISRFLDLNVENPVTEEWIQEANHIIMGKEIEGYRTGEVYVGTLAEAVYFPPKAEDVPELMKKFCEGLMIEKSNIVNAVGEIARQHILFERIHPFSDGNGRTGRIILNQQLVNQGLLPIILEKKSDYRQAFRRYDKNKDTSFMEHLICKGELDAIGRLQSLYEREQIQESTDSVYEELISRDIVGNAKTTLD